MRYWPFDILSAREYRRFAAWSNPQPGEVGHPDRVNRLAGQ
jgi:hypothetical protein